MTQEEKELLLKDLCARLPYGLIIQYHYKRGDNCIDEDRELDFSDVETLKYNNVYPQDNWCEISWKPYLRPMSSMTEEERKELENKFGIIDIDDDLVDFGELPSINSVFCLPKLMSLSDWLNKKMFDWRGLIPLNLAIAVTEENNPYK